MFRFSLVLAVYQLTNVYDSLSYLNNPIIIIIKHVLCSYSHNGYNIFKLH